MNPDTMNNLGEIMNTTTQAYIRNLVRTGVPVAVGTVVAWFASKGWNLKSGQFAVLAPVFSTVYYGVIRGAEKKYPKLSWLLGALPTTPTLTPTPTPAKRGPKPKAAPKK